MKLETIERNIRYGTKPYSEIYRNAEKRGLRVVWKHGPQETEVTAYDKSGHFAKSVYYTNCPESALYNEYSYPKHR